jgi:DNA repair photolyase
MIISASKRTDIPAFYGEWFMNNLRRGSFQVRNPLFPKKISQIDFKPSDIECIVFWTKNPAPFLKYLPEIEENYKFYFTFSLNDYPITIEKHLPNIDERIRIFKQLSNQIGRNRVIWRYDPILFTEELGVDFHLNSFENIAKELSGFTETCVISVADRYVRNDKNLKSIQWRQAKDGEISQLLKSMLNIAQKYNLKLQSCAEEGLAQFGVLAGKCIDDSLISRLTGNTLKIPSQKERFSCQCVQSVDVGVYNTCLHDCVYCYANYSFDSVKKNYEQHDKESLMMIGSSRDEDIITIKKVIRQKKGIAQNSIFDSISEEN